MESFKRGEDLFFKRAGQFGFACATCHAPNALLGKRLRGNVLTTPFGDAASYPAYLTGRGELTSLQQRMRICQTQMRTAPLKPGDRSYDDLEVLFTVMSNGYPLSGVSMR
jgi:sulfur-oxidizing protein SoxA